MYLTYNIRICREGGIARNILSMPLRIHLYRVSDLELTQKDVKRHAAESRKGELEKPETPFNVGNIDQAE